MASKALASKAAAEPFGRGVSAPGRPGGYYYYY